MLYNDKKFIGNVIKNARSRNNLTQALLAEKTGMTEKSISNIENGRQFPAVNNFLHIIEVLNIQIKEFGITMEDDGNAEKNELICRILNADTVSCSRYLAAIEFTDKLLNI